jgi:hypothetical protein
MGGAVAQLGERCNRTAEVRGSNPLSSTSQNFPVSLGLAAKTPSIAKTVGALVWRHGSDAESWARQKETELDRGGLPPNIRAFALTPFGNRRKLRPNGHARESVGRKRNAVSRGYFLSRPIAGCA